MSFGQWLYLLRWFWLFTAAVLLVLCLLGPVGQRGALGIAVALLILAPITWLRDR